MRPFHVLIAFILTAFVSVSATAQRGGADGEWLSYGADQWSTKYSPLDQINKDNFDDLEFAWQWDSIDADIMARDDFDLKPAKISATPLMVNGVLYTSTAFSQVAALDPGTGEAIWTYDPGSWKAGRPANMGFIHRGVSYWSEGDEERLIIATGHSRLIALNPKTGQPITSFGDNGTVNLLEGLNRPARVSVHQVNSPPMICNGVIVVGSVIFDRPTLQHYLRGDVRGFDIRTGKKLWQFNSIPQEGEFGNETWENDSWKHSGNTNVWSLISADEELGYVYLPFGAGTNDFYGGHRPGDNLFANSLVCLDVKTGKRVWHFQTVHHDLWDYDLPCAPNLVDIVVDGKPIKAVAQMGKTGFCYVFDRVTGKPVWPIEEVAVPTNGAPGEKPSPTQPVPTKPAPFSGQGVTEDDLIDFTPEIKQEALKIASQYDIGPVFTPPTERGLIKRPSDGGGANWHGAAVDPETSIVYVPASSGGTIVELVKPDPARSNMRFVVDGYTAGAKGPFGLPLTKPPYSNITAIDLNSGEHVWMSPIGPGYENHPKLKHLNLAPTGGGGKGLPLLTKSLFFAGMRDSLYAFNKKTGEQIGQVPFNDSNGNGIGYVTGAPMTYMHEGKQYIVAGITGRGAKTQLVALALP